MGSTFVANMPGTSMLPGGENSITTKTPGGVGVVYAVMAPTDVAAPIVRVATHTVCVKCPVAAENPGLP